MRRQLQRQSFLWCRQICTAVRHRILVVGSVNADILVEVDRLPAAGETTLALSARTRVIPGGKGANQAVAAARMLSQSSGVGQLGEVSFIGQFGDDDHAAMLRGTLEENGVDTTYSGQHANCPSGQGFVFLQSNGSLSSVVVAGSNAEWSTGSIDSAVSQVTDSSVAAVMIQRECPEDVNLAVAEAATQAGVIVMQDVGGEDRPISDHMLRQLTYITPNLSELARLTNMHVSSDDEVIAAARVLQDRGAQSVLVTLGASGALLLTQTGEVLRQQSVPPPGAVLDETAAGDCFRSGFCVGLVEGRSEGQALVLGAAAGAVAVSRRGAIPSVPSREECEQLLTTAAPAAANGECAERTGPVFRDLGQIDFASRLNSMKDRRDLASTSAVEDNVLGWIARQSSVDGLTMVDLNFPQHLDGSAHQLQIVGQALQDADLRAGAMCMRYPPEYRLGAFTHPEESVRKQAIDLTISAAQCGHALGTNELVVWSAYCGYDYSLQVDYVQMWQRMVEGFQQVCDAQPGTKVSLEFKPTDENTRFFAVPSTGAAMQLVQAVDRPNMGLTLDIGHCLMAGENPAQSVAMVGSKLFGVQLNDGYGRLGAEDGLMFGSVHPQMALEFVWWLQQTGYDGHIYFDTFPGAVDPVAEAEYNIKAFKSMWSKAERLHAAGLQKHLSKHDALAALEMVDRI